MKKTILLTLTIIASLSFSDSAQPCLGKEPSCNPCNYALNTPYKTDLDPCSWGVFVSASYLYWNAYQDGLIFYTQFAQNTPDSGELNLNYNQGQVACDYNSAFKVGLGWQSDCSDWELSGSYLWYHHSFGNFFSFEPSEEVGFVSRIAPVFELNLNPYSGSIISPTTISSKWNLAIDLIDLEVSRKYYVGKFLLFRSACGLRNAYITQEIEQNPAVSFADTSSIESDIDQKISSWALGPKASLDCKWLLNCGFSLLAKTSASLLYTSYTLKGNESSTFYGGTSGRPNRIQTFTPDTLYPCCLRPYLDMGLGLNWETALFCNQWYLDLYIGYEFIALWSQNMFRSIESFPNRGGSSVTWTNTPSVDDLFLHGLTVSAIFKF